MGLMMTRETAGRIFRTCLHEAGHTALAAYYSLIDGAEMLRPSRVTIVPSEWAHGAMHYSVPEGTSITKEHVDRFTIVAHAGDEAVKIWADATATFSTAKLETLFKSLPPSADERKATDTEQAASLCPTTGHNEQCRHAAIRLLEYAPIKAATGAITEALLAKGEIHGDEIARLFMQEWNANGGSGLTVRIMQIPV